MTPPMLATTSTESSATATSDRRTSTAASAAIRHDVTFTTEPGRGPFHLILLPGLVPDGPETFLRQRRLFAGYGPSSLATYPYQGFQVDHVLDDIRLRIEAAAAAGQRPVVMAVSFGAGLYLELLRRAKAAGRPLPVVAQMLVSPMTSRHDLSPLLSRLIKPILDETADPAAITVALEKGRSFFRMLASRSAGGDAGVRWNTFLTPTGIRNFQEGRIRARIERTVNAIPIDGGHARIRGLIDMPGIDASTRLLSEAPTQILWGSKERHTLTMEGPGTSLLCRPDLACRCFPVVEVQYVYDRNGDEVPHASLLKHAAAFNDHLRRFLDLHRQRLTMERLRSLPLMDRMLPKSA